MRQITIATHVSLAAAAGAGSPSYGEGRLCMSSEVLLALSPEARSLIAESLERDGALLLPAPGGLYTALEVPPTQTYADGSLRATTQSDVVLAIEQRAAAVAAHRAELDRREAESLARRTATARERAEQILAMTDEQGLVSAMYSWGSGLAASEADPDTLALVQRAQARVAGWAALAEERRAAAREQSEAKRRAEVEAEQHDLRKLVREHGTRDQIERMHAGVLPEDEVRALLRDLLPTLALPLWDSPEVEQAIDHAAGCDARGEVQVSVTEYTGTYSAEQWAALKAAREVASGAGCTIEVRCHEATCEQCDERAEALVIEVALTRAGHQWSALYALPGSVHHN